jgi:membrane-associated protease RseP (regulator of RpoE activity)
MSGTTVHCYLLITNNEEDKDLSIAVAPREYFLAEVRGYEKNASVMYDRQNNVYRPVQVKLGNILANHDQYKAVKLRLISRVETVAVVKFENVAPTAREIALLELGCGSPEYDDNVFRPQLRNIPVSAVLFGVNISPAQDPRGIAVAGVTPAGAAESSGIRPGDVIVSVAGTPVHNHADLWFVLSRFSPGDSVPVMVARGNDLKTIDVTFGERPR